MSFLSADWLKAETVIMITWALTVIEMPMETNIRIITRFLIMGNIIIVPIISLTGMNPGIFQALFV